MNTVEVCFTPKLFPYILTKENYIVVIIDILRASTSICAAFDSGVESIIPVAGLEDVKRYKQEGFLVAAEQDGIKLDFADFGNSPFNFQTPQVIGKTIAYCTTNGTQAIELTKHADVLCVGSFINVSALAQWIEMQQKNVVILCSGWKGKFNIEDTLCAGALAQEILQNEQYRTECDSVAASVDLWNMAKENLLNYIEKAAHRHRLKRLGLDDILEYTFSVNTSQVIPVYKNGHIIDVAKK